MIHRDKPRKHLTPEFWLCIMIGAVIVLALWPDGDGWTRTGCVMVAVGAGLLGWTRPWEYVGEEKTK